ncbi:tetratricopeptide repeat protein [Desulfovibrio sp. JC010]|uniref:tetratricopeptide repeat protein n=1 Tax=Desulfovibrio sp. JC010 TaxID=2593641 RepID=UPI0013D4FEE4|nr:tetratricopeptide repeat protein [Desulfovibrio sp. JC010]NDV27953.1 tetratricopeptide repeat protein [Desulfovibrio sp. JC010]
MRSILKKKILPSLLAASVLFGAGGNVFAASAKKNDSFESWLEKYGAWDILEQNYSQTGDTPELILKRAETAFNLGRYSACLETLQSTPAFTDKTQEITRLWLGGKCQRALGDPVKGVIWFSQAARLMDQRTMASKFKKDSQLKSIWFDVWRSLYWGYQVTPEAARESRKMLLDQTFAQAEKVWPTTYFVINSKAKLGALNSTSEIIPVISNSTIVSDDDRNAIAQSLAAASIGEWEKADNALTAVSNSTVQTFWKSVNQYLESGNTPESVSIFNEENLIRPNSFFEAGVLEPVTVSPTLWQLGAPTSPAWNAFRKQLLEMKPQEALKTIDRETGSLLLSSDLVNALQNYRLAFAFLSGDMELAENVLKRLDTDTLPMSLRVACGIAFKLPLSRVLSSADYGKNENIYIISGLSEAAGINYLSDIDTPFWKPISRKALNPTINSNPLDRLLVFADLNAQADKKQSIKIARRCAFLFPKSKLGAESFIYLADQAAQNRDFKLSAYYLKRVDQDKFGPELRLQWLSAAVAYDLAVGKDDKAMKAYNEILKSGGTLPAEKELKLALMIQQKGDLKKAQAILERIWSTRDDLENDELRAEVLFWIAEGEHAMGRKEKALKHYLELAWEFPEQNIWAVTAMYRSSMIYEHKGQFETAKRFLKTVIKRADRKAQKEAAKARLNAIDTKLAKVGADKEVSFPF